MLAFITVLTASNASAQSAFAYAAEESAVATGKLQVVYDGDRLYGSMYMLPIGLTKTGLFTIVMV